MKILITGGAGFIGSHLANKLLLDPTNEILIVDNLTTGRRENIPDSPNVKFIEGSIGCTAFCSAIFQIFKPDFLIHAAASYKNPLAWHEDVITNSVGAVNLINECKKHNVKKIIYFQTALAYGISPKESPISLSHPYFSGVSNSIESSYAVSKVLAEKYIQLSGIPFTSFRLCNMIGEANLSGAIPSFHKNIINNEPITIIDGRRDFLYVSELVSVVVKSITTHIDKVGYYNISSGKDYSIKDIFYMIVDLMGVDAPKNITIKPVSDDDTKTILLDAQKTYMDFDWIPKTELKIAIHKAIKYYEKYPITESYTHLKLK